MKAEKTAKEQKNAHMYELKKEEAGGSIFIADEVIAVIAGIAATETEGVEKLCGGITSDLVSKIGIRKLSSGVSVTMKENRVCVLIHMEISYGYKVKDVCRKVQQNIRSSIETMTGLKVEKTDIHVVTVAFDN